MGQQRTAVLAQVQRVETNSKAGIEISDMPLEEVIVVAVHVQHGAPRLEASGPAYQGGDYLALVIRSHGECQHLVASAQDIGLPARDLGHGVSLRVGRRLMGSMMDCAAAGPPELR